METTGGKYETLCLCFSRQIIENNTQRGGAGVEIAIFWEKNCQVNVIIIKEWPNPLSSILKNLDDFRPGIFIRSPYN